MLLRFWLTDTWHGRRCLHVRVRSRVLTYPVVGNACLDRSWSLVPTIIRHFGKDPSDERYGAVLDADTLNCPVEL